MAWKMVGELALALLSTHQHEKTRSLIMATAAENQARLDALSDRAEKSKGEILAAIDALKAQAEAGQELNWERVESAVQQLDDLNPDAPSEPTEPVDPLEPQPGGEPTDPGTDTPTPEPGTGEDTGTDDTGTDTGETPGDNPFTSTRNR